MCCCSVGSLPRVPGRPVRPSQTRQGRAVWHDPNIRKLMKWLTLNGYDGIVTGPRFSELEIVGVDNVILFDGLYRFSAFWRRAIGSHR
eukprot:symbB.v1.2.020510.t1/scaffold1733.1/size104216/4